MVPVNLDALHNLRSRAPRSILAVLLLVASVAGCGAPGTQDDGVSAAPSRAFIGAIREPTTFVDWEAGTTFDLLLADLVFHRLARPGADPGTFVPDLADSWETLPDGASLRFYLRDDLTWEDGRPVTADDVVFSLLRAATGSISNTKQRIVEVTRAASDEVVVRFDAPYRGMLADAVFGHVYPKHLLENGIPPSFHREPVGSGPYRLERWSPQQAISLARREDTPRRAGIERLVVRIFRDKAAAYRELEGGNLDLLRKAQQEVFDRLVQLDHVDGLQTPSSGYFYLAWNTRRPPWNRAAVRRAMTSMIDRQAIAERFEGEGVVAEGPLSPDAPGFDGRIASPGHDPAAARRELLEANLAIGNDGKWVGPDGKPIRVALLAYAGQPVHAAIVGAIADYLRRGGFETDVRLLPDSDVEFRVGNGDFDAALYSEPGRVLDLAGNFGGSGATPNRAGFADDEIDAWIEAGDEESLLLACRRIVELQPWTFLHYRNDRTLFHRRLRGLAANPRDPFAVVEQWQIAAESR